MLQLIRCNKKLSGLLVAVGDQVFWIVKSRAKKNPAASA
jgi:hypothetical protein